jgi:hypothetical protein
MTVLVQHSTQVDQPGILRRRATGTPAEIEATINLLKHSGVLVSASVPRRVGPADPRVTVIVRVRENVPAESPAPRQAPDRRWVKPLVIGGGILAVLAGLIVGGYLAAQQVVRATSGMGLAAVGFLAVVSLLFLLIRSAGRKGVCVGLHCEGCGHR